MVKGVKGLSGGEGWVKGLSGGEGGERLIRW